MARNQYAGATHCRNNHEFTEANTIRRNGHRQCRECVRANQRAYAARHHGGINAPRVLTESELRRMDSRIEDGVSILDIAGMFNVGVDVVRERQAKLRTPAESQTRREETPATQETK